MFKYRLYSPPTSFHGYFERGRRIFENVQSKRQRPSPRISTRSDFARKTVIKTTIFRRSAATLHNHNTFVPVAIEKPRLRFFFLIFFNRYHDYIDPIDYNILCLIAIIHEHVHDIYDTSGGGNSAKTLLFLLFLFLRLQLA